MFTIRLQTMAGCVARLLVCIVVALAAAPWTYGWQDEKPADSGNIYLAPEGLSPAELAQFIEKMQAKPKSIQAREGFAEAIVEAADRIIAADNVDSRTEEIGLLAKFNGLLARSERGDKKADEQLLEMSRILLKDTRRTVAGEATFHLLRQRVMEAENLPVEKLPDLLSELRAFMASMTLESRHVGLASRTVGIINRLADDDEAARAYRDFGRLFARSEDRELSAYGRKIEQAAQRADPAKLASSYLGKTLQLEGRSADGRDFDWALYRDKVVLVHFWAVWCSPCKAQIAGLKQLHSEYHDRGFDIVGVNMDTEAEVVEQFIAQRSLPWINLVGEDENAGWKHPLAKKYGITALPASFLVGKDGKVIAQHLSSEQLSSQLEELLNPTGK